MTFTKQEVEHIAKLSRIEISDKEGETLAQQLSSILEYVIQLQEVDTDTITHHYQVAGLENVMDEDVVVESSEEERRILLAAMPQRVGDLLKVKGVFKD